MLRTIGGVQGTHTLPGGGRGTPEWGVSGITHRSGCGRGPGLVAGLATV